MVDLGIHAETKSERADHIKTRIEDRGSREGVKGLAYLSVQVLYEIPAPVSRSHVLQYIQ